jgi:hypothetical protein
MMNLKRWQIGAVGLSVLGAFCSGGCASKKPAAGTGGAPSVPVLVGGTGGQKTIGSGGIGGAGTVAVSGGTGAVSVATGGVSGATLAGTAAVGGVTASPIAGTTSPVAGSTGSAPTVPMDSVLQHHNSAKRDGVYADPAFTRVAAAKLHRDKTFMGKVSGPVYAQPLYFSGGPGGKDLVIIASEQNQVSALSATDGSVVWQKSLGTPATVLPCGNISPLGITGTPIIDATSRTLYLDSMQSVSGAAKHMIYALSLDDGSTRAGWPVDVSAKVKSGSMAFDSSVQNQRGGLALLNNTVYVPYGGHFGDCGNYHGWVVGVPLDKPDAPFGWATRAKASGVWAPGGISSDGTSLFVVTGNSMSDGGAIFSSPTTWGDGEAVIRLPPTLQFSMQPADYASAMNWQALDSSDSDVGGSGPVLFNVPGATPADLAIALGKDGSSYLLDAKNLGGQGHFVSSPGRVSTEQIMNAPVAYNTPTGTFVAFKGIGANCPAGSPGSKITALKISAGAPPTVSTAWCNGPGGLGSPMVTNIGNNAESIVWYIGSENDNKLRGFNGETGATIFDGGGADEAMEQIPRFQTPIAVKGRIFVAGGNTVYAFTTM